MGRLGNPAALMLATELVRSRRESEPSEQSGRTSPVGRYVLWGLGITAAAGAGYLVLRRIRRGFWFRKAVDEIDDPGKGAYYAQRLYNALNPDSPFGLGTDEDAVRDTILEIPHRQMWEAVKDAYEGLTRSKGQVGKLPDDLRGELTRHQLQEITAILAMLPANARDARQQDPFAVTPQRLEAWARRIYAGAEYDYMWYFGGTDEAAIYRALEEVPTLVALCQLNSVYRRVHPQRLSLFEELREELNAEEMQRVVQIIQEKPDANSQNFQRLLREGCA